MSGHFNLRAALLINTLGCGLEVLACAGFTYIPPLLRKSGHSETTMALTMGLGPLLGFLFVPYIGEASDNLKSRYGRRKPFILFLSIGAAASFIIMPYILTLLSGSSEVSPKGFDDEKELFSIISKGGGTENSVAIFVTITCLVVLFDFCSQVALTPFEALLADMGKPLGTTGSDKLYQVYSFMIGVGGVIGYLITSLDWKKRANFLSFFGAVTQEERVFFVVFILFVMSLFFALRYSKDGLQAGRRVKLDTKNDALIIQKGEAKGIPTFISRGVYYLCPTGLLRLLQLPKCFTRLCVFQFFAWTSLMSYNLFFTDFVGEAVFDGDPTLEAGPLKNELYDEGVNVGSMGLLAHCVTCSAFPLLHRTLLRDWSVKLVLVSTLLASTVAALCMVLWPSPVTMVIMSLFPGFLMGALLSIPFHLLTKYHDREEVFMWDSVHPRGVGTDVAILDSMYFLAEFSLSVFDSVFVFLVGSTYAYMYATIVFGFVAFGLAFNVVFDESSLPSSTLQHIKAESLLDGVSLSAGGTSVQKLKVLLLFGK
ncbi:solute carrier family 45 member 3-like isoform X2 [Symsagittifera roscoffensis]|uniref:solute carrier family 45 member 3-like isoform X2 n=1 Tax=Symsagittifera roscoffensis TaxID=84072 RepID=UPI00307CC324